MTFEEIPFRPTTEIATNFVKIRIDVESRRALFFLDGMTVADFPADELFIDARSIWVFVDSSIQTLFITPEKGSMIWVVTTKPYLTIRRIGLRNRDEDQSYRYLSIYKCDEWFVICTEAEYLVYDSSLEQQYELLDGTFCLMEHNYVDGKLWFFETSNSSGKKKAIEFYSWAQVEADLSEDELQATKEANRLLSKIFGDSKTN